jgi:hypothetical protein
MVGKAGIQDMTGFAGTGENIQGEEHTLPISFPWKSSFPLQSLLFPCESEGNPLSQTTS